MILERSEELKPFSREHHHGLLLCWKIRTGISNGVSFDRIKKYTDWFYTAYLAPHFEAEEKYVLSILGKDDPMVKKVLSNRRRLKKLFLGHKKPPEIALSLLEEELESHIRFEERQLFQYIQEVATTEQLDKIRELHKEREFQENTEDMFWE